MGALLKLMSRATGRAILFEVRASPDCKVFIAGTFNDWDPSTHPLDYHPEDGVFRAILYLPSGTHQYKFLVDGIWHRNCRCPNCVQNDYGSFNSIIRI
jgi:1,4-alpha-glucan branching enzyme